MSILVYVLSAVWAPYVLYLLMASTGHADALPEQWEGFIRIILAVATIAVIASNYIVTSNRQIVTAAKLEILDAAAVVAWAQQRTEVVVPARRSVVGRATVIGDEPTAQILTRRRDEQDLNQYMQDAAEAYEVGRRAGYAEGLAERDEGQPSS